MGGWCCLVQAQAVRDRPWAQAGALPLSSPGLLLTCLSLAGWTLLLVGMFDRQLRADKSWS